MTIEHDVIQDVKDYLIDAVCQYTDCGLKPWGGDLASLLFEEPNANGTLDFSRAVSYRYLEEHPAFTAAITDRMEHEYGMLDPEALYEYDEETDEYIESSYIENNAEAIKVIGFFDVAQVILQLCPTVEAHWNEPLELEEDIGDVLEAEIEAVDVAEVTEYF